jgi:hypothetical protein
MSRLHKTLADYLVIAVSPAMIMVLIGSLVFFLVDVCYEGSHQGRLEWVLACFILAAVLIGRIAIEIGKEHAMMYAAPLALVTAMAMNQFVEFQGRAAPYAMLINLGLMAMIWYCAHKLTWDCTMVDESQDASGEGLLERLGLEKGKPQSPEPGGQTIPSGTSAPSTASTPDKPPEPTGVTGEYRPRPWWERLLKPPPRPHSPGASVVWFSLAALAMFGLGQCFIPATDAARRRHAFAMLVLFAACALGLLLTTSFLGLRRYLRQRRLQMPATMAGLWIVIGCSLVVAVLAFAVLLPRPSPEFAASQVPWKTKSPEHGSSRNAVGRDAAEQNTRDDDSGNGESAENESDKSADNGEGNGPPKAGGGKSEGKGQGKSEGKGEGEKGEKSENGGEKSGNEKSESGKAESGKTAQKGKQGSNEGQRDGSGAKIKPPAESKSSGGPKSTSGSKSSGTPKSPSGKGVSPPRPQSPAIPSPPLGGLAGLLLVLQWLIYAAVIVVIAVGLWRSRHRLPEILRRFLDAWRGFWDWLFGRRRKGAPVAGDQPQTPGPAPRRFADYVDPFAAGETDRYRPDELVRYSFEALEAWARDHGLSREPDQTPYEFSQRIGVRVASLAGDLRTLSDLYYRAAYARGSLSPTAIRPLAMLWEHLRTAGSPSS